MKTEFIVNRQGKDFVLYAGLLDQAHRQGLKRISTKLLQAPTEENGHLAICFAEVETEKGVFSGIGDASPQNVGRMIAPHITRMSETRAKARALRDAINVTMVTLEELGDDDEPAQPKAEPSKPQHGRQPAPKAERPPAAIVPATEEQRRQVGALRKLLKQPSISTQALTTEQAAREIAHWTATAQHTPAAEEHYTELVALANQLHNAGVDPAFPDGTFSIHAYVQHLRRMKTAVAEHIPAAAAK